MKIPAAFFYALAIFGLDIWSKNWVHENLRDHDLEVIPDFFKLSLVHNHGIAFGLFDYGSSHPIKSLILISVALVALGAVISYALKTPPSARMTQIALGFLLGGILGNLVDRMLRSYVVDFLEFNFYLFKFPTFNLADAGITIGIGLLLLQTLRERNTPAEEEPRETAARGN
ncbi:MAG TPA: signal peptidase II [Acidobacteriota bacterium]